MKKLFCYLILAFTAGNIQAQTLSQNFNSGNRTLESNMCWQSPGSSFSNASAELIEGQFTLRTGQLTGGGATPNGLITPWSKLTGSGNVTFQHKLTTWNSGSIRAVYVSLESADNPNVQDTIYKFSFSATNATSLQTISVAIPAYTAGKVYRLRLFGYGTGGNSRWLLDNVSYPGEYWSSPAFGCTPLPTIQDADKDGVADSEDSFPNDPYRAYSALYPSNDYGTLLYEDLWPSTGDYDFNDLVMNYRINTITNAANQVVEVKYTLVAKAIGGALQNGFAFQIDSLSPQKIISISRSKSAGNLFTLAANGTEANQAFANIPVVSNVTQLLTNAGGLGVNIDTKKPFVAPDTTTMVITFLQNGNPASGQTPVLASTVGINNFNPYIIVNQQRQTEVHGANRIPSALAGTSNFSTSDDNSNPGAKRFYKTKNNLPWMLNIDANIVYPQEGNDISTGFLKLLDWVNSGGISYADWYMDKPGYRNKTKLYVP